MKIVVPSMIVPDFRKSTQSMPIDFEATQRLFYYISDGLKRGLGKHADDVEIGFLLLSATTAGNRYSPSVVPSLIDRVREVDKDAYIAVVAWETEHSDVRPYIRKAENHGVDVLLPPSLKEVKDLEGYARYATRDFREITNFISYENPGIAGVSYTLPIIKKLKNDGIVKGIKESNLNPNHFKKVLPIEDFTKLLGVEELFHLFLKSDYQGKIDGIVPSTANAFPLFIGRLICHYIDGNFRVLRKDIRKLQKEIHPALYGDDYKRKYPSLLYYAALNGCGDPKTIQEKYSLDESVTKQLRELCDSRGL